MTRLTLLSAIIVVAAFVAAVTGIQATGTAGRTIESIHGIEVTLHGTGVYRTMSADVAIQGIAQDWITLTFALPLLVTTLLVRSRDHIRTRVVRAGTLGYLLVTYLFYLVMATYNELFLVYTVLLGTAFFATVSEVITIARHVELVRPPWRDDAGRAAGLTLIGNALLVGMLWLSIVIPPLLDGTVVPTVVQHYTTLVVQGLNLGLMLPLAVVAGTLWLRRSPLGAVGAPVYLVFLSILMTALVAKLIAMGMYGSPVMPAIVIIPTILVITMAVTGRLLAAIPDVPTAAATPTETIPPPR